MTDALEWCRRIRRGSLLAVVALVPLVMVPRALFQPTNPPKLAVLMVGLSVALGARLVEVALGRSLRSLRFALVPAVAITLPLIIGWVFGLHRGWALFGTHPRYLGLIPYLVFAIFGLLLAEAFASDPRVIAWTLTFSAGLAAAYTVLQAFALEPFVWADESKVLGIIRSSSTFGNPNFSGAFFSICLPMALSLALWDRDRRDIAWVLTALIGFGWLVSFSQGPWIAGAAGLLVVAAVALPRTIRRARVLAWAGILTLSLISAGAVVATMVSEAAVERLGSTVESRSWAWETAASMFAERPFTGWGPNVYAAEGIRFRPSDEALVAYWIAEDPHNFALSQLASAGLLGAAGFVILVVWTVRRVDAALRRADLVAVGFAGGATAYLVQGLVSIDEIGVRLAAWVSICGLALTAYGGVEQELPTSRSRRVLALPLGAMAIVTIAASTWWAIGAIKAEVDVLKGYRAAQDNDPHRSVQNFERALSFYDNYEYRGLYGVKIGELGTRRGPAGAPYIAKMRDAYSYLEDFPDVNGLVNQARLLYAWAEKVDPTAYAEALSLYRRATELDPHHPLLAVETSDVLRGMGRLQEALAILKRFEDKEPPQASYYGALALTYAEMGEFASAAEYADAALRIDGNDARAKLALEEVSRGQA